MNIYLLTCIKTAFSIKLITPSQENPLINIDRLIVCMYKKNYTLTFDNGILRDFIHSNI